jgi:hypothetical protein
MRRTGMLARGVALATVCVAATLTPAASAPALEATAALQPAVARAQLDNLGADAAGLRTTLSNGTVAASIEALAVRNAALTAAPPQASPLPDLTRLQPAIRAPVSDLTVAVQSAWTLLDTAPGSSDAAAALVAGSLDRSLPALRRAAAAAPDSAPTRDADCDLVDQPPLLCVASEVSQTHTADVALLVDLGGNDTYRNTAGGAPFAAAQGAPGVPISVNVDLGGNDEYRPAPRKNTLIANGAADAGAVGLLLDDTGDDRYLTTATAPLDLLAVQGAATGGTGMLLDQAGSDTYEVSGAAGTVVAQGGAYLCQAVHDAATPQAGAGCSTAGLIDRGVGTDTYVIAPSTAGAGQSRTVVAQGYGNLGTGVLFDQGGPGALRVSLTSVAGTPAGEQNPPGLSVYAQGVALLGSRGLVLTGQGDTDYDVMIRADRQSLVRAWAQGVAHSGGVAGIDDSGGDDTYTAEVRTLDERSVTVDTTCDCRRAQATIKGQPAGVILSLELLAQGVGESNGTALVRDRSGDDTYTVRGEQHLSATLNDHVPDRSQAAALTVTGLLTPTVRAQGAGREGTGLLADDGGQDRYSLLTSNTTTADVHTEPAAAGAPAVVLVGNDTAGVAGQGATAASGTGALLDLAGTGDVVLARSSVDLNGPGTGADVYRSGTAWPEVQGALGGVLAMLGEDPVVTSSPSRPVCRTSQGRRGFGQWQDCGVSSDDPETQAQGSISTLRHASGGLAPEASGSVPTVRFDPATPSAATVAVVPAGEPPPHGTAMLPIRATLTDGDGRPLAGQRVRFDLQRGCRLLCALTPAAADASGTYWDGTWAAEATTGTDGTVSTGIPLTLNTLQWSASTPYLWRIYATYDGAAGVQPRHAALPLTLTAASSP